mgnify:CR=1 FL=1|tara:strand:- start:619 stop:927 length:309 start_codon:yes stop_codon:yes gene_type:complete
MKILEVNNGKGYFLKGEETVELDQIGKEDLLNLLDIAIATEFEMDEYDVEKLHNKAHQIIYKHLYQKFEELKQNKDRFKDESERAYKDAIEKYSEAIKIEDN